MLLLRILGLPISMAVFSILYVASTKMPNAMETSGLVLWVVFPLLIVVAAIKRASRYAIRG